MDERQYHLLQWVRALPNDVDGDAGMVKLLRHLLADMDELVAALHGQRSWPWRGWKMNKELRDALRVATALVLRLGGEVTLSDRELQEVEGYTLRRTDGVDHGMILSALHGQGLPHQRDEKR